MTEQPLTLLTSSHQIALALNQVLPKDISQKQIVFACIGTDRSTGDCLGPLVGTFLKTLGYSNVIGTLDDPLHGANLHERFYDQKIEHYVVAIDAGLGRMQSVETCSILKGGIKPGAGVQKNLPPVGNVSIMGIVNIGGFMEHAIISSTRLNVVMNLANQITQGIHKVLPISPLEKMALQSIQ